MHKLNFMLLAHIIEKNMATTLVHICNKTQPATTSTSHVIVTHVPETNMSAKLHIYVIHQMAMQVPHMKAWESTM